MHAQYIAALEARIKELDGKMEAAAERIRKTGGEEKLDSQKQYFYYKALRSQITDKIEQAKSAGEEDWNTHKVALEAVYDEMVGYMDGIYKEFGDETGLY